MRWGLALRAAWRARAIVATMRGMGTGNAVRPVHAGETLREGLGALGLSARLPGPVRGATVRGLRT